MIVRTIKWLVLLCVLTISSQVNAQASIPDAKEYTIVMVLWRGMTDAERGFKDYLRHEGVKVNYIIRDCNKDKTRLPKFIAEIKRIRPDLVYTFGTTVTRSVVGTTEQRSAVNNILDIPVVFNIVADPLGAKLTKSLASTNSNFTGVSHTVPIATQINVMKQARPLHKLAVLYNPQEKNSRLTLAALKIQAQNQNFTIIEAPLAIGSDGKPIVASISTRMEKLASLKPDFLYLPPDSFLIANADKVTETARALHMVTFSSTEGPIRKNGAMMGIVSTYFSVGKFAGYKARQILQKAAKPASLPVETLKQFSLLVNVHTARQLDFFPPVSMLAVAEVVK